MPKEAAEDDARVGTRVKCCLQWNHRILISLTMYFSTFSISQKSFCLELKLLHSGNLNFPISLIKFGWP